MALKKNQIERALGLARCYGSVQSVSVYERWGHVIIELSQSTTTLILLLPKPKFKSHKKGSEISTPTKTSQSLGLDKGDLTKESEVDQRTILGFHYFRV